jgi:thiol-disulfide isomerase/thioredoxin
MEAAERTVSGVRRTASWPIALAYLLALFPAAVLILAAFFKAGDPALFADQITAHRVTPAAWSHWLAYVLIGAELGLAVALIAFVWPRVVFGLTIFLMVFFIGVTAWAWLHGNAEGCGCFGRLVDRSPGAVILEDAIIVATSLLGMLLTRRARTRPWQWIVFAALALPALGLTAFGRSLPLDGIVVGVRPGTSLANMALDGPAPPLEEGRVLLALVGSDCPACDGGVPNLKEIAARNDAPVVVAVHAGAAGAAQVWRLRHLPNFRVAWASEKVLRQYYRRLPVTFLLENGVVRRVWWDRIPRPDELPQR